ncbi:MAG: sigma-70 family RNA polymerase sigma factor [Planctomycetes bacterium]|nr:sigma-70 family RNA polymerase sigma factor [Planctomycetota bacterium]
MNKMTTAAKAQKTRLDAGADAAGAPPSRTRRSTRASTIDTLWRTYERKPGDESRNRLVEHYQPLVSDIVRRFAARLPRLIDRGDLDTAANFGLIAAIEGFDPARGVRFETYCERRVRGALLDELRSQDWLSRPFRWRLEQMRRVSEDLRSRLGREPSEAEIAQELGPLEARRAPIPGMSSGFSSPVLSGHADDSGEDSMAGLDVLADPDSDAPRERLGSDDLYRLVAQKLTVQEYQIVYLRYWEDLSLREIGEVLHLSESRVCKIHTRLLERLKERLAAAG